LASYSPLPSITWVAGGIVEVPGTIGAGVGAGAVVQPVATSRDRIRNTNVSQIPFLYMKIPP
jgi:hypothetical protein